MSNLDEANFQLVTATCSPAAQDYIRAIHQLGAQQDGRVTTSALAERLGVRPASVTAMLQKMAAAAPALVDYHKSHGARLTMAGEMAALRVARRHRLLELYLHDKLGYGWDEVHAEADRLEHVISAAMTERLAAALDHPTHDPHGHAIPAADLSYDPPAGRPLPELPPGEAATVQYVTDDDPAVLRALDATGLRPGATVVIARRDAARLWTAVNGGQPLALDTAAANHVYVNRPEPTPTH